MRSRLADDGVDLDAVQLRAVGHRVVHGGPDFSEPVLIDDGVVDRIRALSPLAPLHNPAAVTGIEAARSQFAVPHVAVFDTAFFSTLPPEASTYAVPRDLAQQHAIRRYGFHGTSHHFVSRASADLLGRPVDQLNQIVLHLGNGCSASAIRGGVAIETSMGLTPLQGLVMGTRSGDVDPGLHVFLSRQVGLSIDEIDDLLNKRSGLLGLSGVNDFRALGQRVDAGDEAARLAFDVFVHRLTHYVGAYLAHLGRLDVLVFTAGVGQNSPQVRAALADGLEGLGISVDPARNEADGGASPSRPSSRPTGARSWSPRADERGAGHRPPGRRPRALTPHASGTASRQAAVPELQGGGPESFRMAVRMRSRREGVRAATSEGDR